MATCPVRTDNAEHEIKWIEAPAYTHNGETIYGGGERGVCLDCGETFVR